jgi:ribosomal protein S26
LLVQDKAIKRYSVRNVVELAAIRDLKEACVFEGMVPLPISFQGRV